MLREIRLDVILLILITAAITIYILNATTVVGPLATGQIGVSTLDGTEEPTAEVEATVEATEEPVEAATEEATTEVEVKAEGSEE